MTRRGRVPARPTNGVRTVNEHRHLGGQLGVFHARLGEELLNESLPSAQMRQRGLTNSMARAVDLERCVDERASGLRFGVERVLDHIEEREDHQLAGPSARRLAFVSRPSRARRLRSLSASATSRSLEPKCWYRVRFVTPARAAIASTPVPVMPRAYVSSLVAARSASCAFGRSVMAGSIRTDRYTEPPSISPRLHEGPRLSRAHARCAS